MTYTVQGKIKLITPVQNFANNFYKREVVVEVQDGQYPQLLKFELLKERSAILDDFSPGDPVEVNFDIRGHEHNGSFYNSLVAWKIVPSQES